MNKLFVAVLLLAGAATLLPLQAQTVWRCGANGRSFSDRPCAEGQPVPMAKRADRRTADEVLAAQAVADRQHRLAETLRQERLQREAAPAVRAQAPARAHVAAAYRGESRGTVKPKSATRPESKQAQAAYRPRLQSPSRPPPTAADGIWQAVAPVSPRTKD